MPSSTGDGSTLNLGDSSLIATADTTLAGTPMALAKIETGSGAGIANVSTLDTTATVGTNGQESATRAYVGDNSFIYAGLVRLQADSDTIADSEIKRGAGAGISGVIKRCINSPIYI